MHCVDLRYCLAVRVVDLSLTNNSEINIISCRRSGCRRVNTTPTRIPICICTRNNSNKTQLQPPPLDSHCHVSLYSREIESSWGVLEWHVLTWFFLSLAASVQQYQRQNVMLNRDTPSEVLMRMSYADQLQVSV